MQQQLNFVTIAAGDLDATRRFYHALGWEPLLDVPDEIVFYQTAPGQVLGFFLAAKFNADLGKAGDQVPVSGVTLAHNVGTAEEVAQIVSTMRDAGGIVLKSPRRGEFGGVFHAHVQDPNGVIWEIAHNPGWRVDPDGTVRFG